LTRPATRAAFHDLAPAPESFRDAVLAGLGGRPKAIPCRFLYDAQGSALFEAISALPEYYLTRTEIGILEANAARIAQALGPHCQLIEFGSGSSRKVRILLEALIDPESYIAIDIAREALKEATATLAAAFPAIPVVAICADYTDPRHLPSLLLRGEGRRVGFFPGSTLGNFTRSESVHFLNGARAFLEPEGAMLIGVDLKKDKARLEAAYDDAAGVTAEFTLNLLTRINRELEGDFDLRRFAHEAFYNEAEGRIEIYLQSLADQIVTVAGRRIAFAKGERIHAEYSYKYGLDQFPRLALEAGFQVNQCWTDPERLFGVFLLGNIGHH